MSSDCYALQWPILCTCCCIFSDYACMVPNGSATVLEPCPNCFDKQGPTYSLQDCDYVLFDFWSFWLDTIFKIVFNFSPTVFHHLEDICSMVYMCKTVFRSACVQRQCMASSAIFHSHAVGSLLSWYTCTYKSTLSCSLRNFRFSYEY